MSKARCHVVIQTAFLGDLFLAIPLLKKLKLKYPADHLVLVCKSGLGEYFLNEKLVDTVLEVKKNSRQSYVEALKSLNTLPIETVFCVHRSIRSQLLCLQIRAVQKIGFKSLLSRFIFNHSVVFQKQWPEALRQLWLMTAVDSQLKSQLMNTDWSQLNTVDPAGALKPVPKEFQGLNSNSALEKMQKRIAIFPGSVWATKKWTESGFREVTNYFIEKGYEVFLMGGADEKDLCEKIKSQIPDAPQVTVKAGQMTIAQSVEFIKSCDVVICNDSAPAHMAASQNVKVVTIFGPTTLQLGFRPWSDAARVVQNNSLTCRPCGKHGHQVCPLGHHHCMTQIGSAAVIQAAVTLLESNH